MIIFQLQIEKKIVSTKKVKHLSIMVIFLFCCLVLVYFLSKKKRRETDMNEVSNPVPHVHLMKKSEEQPIYFIDIDLTGLDLEERKKRISEYFDNMGDIYNINQNSLQGTVKNGKTYNSQKELYLKKSSIEKEQMFYLTKVEKIQELANKIGQQNKIQGQLIYVKKDDQSKILLKYNGQNYFDLSSKSLAYLDNTTKQWSYLTNFIYNIQSHQEPAITFEEVQYKYVIPMPKFKKVILS